MFSFNKEFGSRNGSKQKEKKKKALFARLRSGA
jgi:hypothetical protein